MKINIDNIDKIVEKLKLIFPYQILTTKFIQASTHDHLLLQHSSIIPYHPITVDDELEIVTNTELINSSVSIVREIDADQLSLLTTTVNGMQDNQNDVTRLLLRNASKSILHGLVSIIKIKPNFYDGWTTSIESDVLFSKVDDMDCYTFKLCLSCIDPKKKEKMKISKFKADYVIEFVKFLHQNFFQHIQIPFHDYFSFQFNPPQTDLEKYLIKFEFNVYILPSLKALNLAELLSGNLAIRGTLEKRLYNAFWECIINEPRFIADTKDSKLGIDPYTPMPFDPAFPNHCANTVFRYGQLTLVVGEGPRDKETVGRITKNLLNLRQRNKSNAQQEIILLSLGEFKKDFVSYVEDDDYGEFHFSISPVSINNNLGIYEINIKDFSIKIKLINVSNMPDGHIATLDENDIRSLYLNLFNIKNNIVFIHCKGGRGRSGEFALSLKLFHQWHSLFNVNVPTISEIELAKIIANNFSNIQRKRSIRPFFRQYLQAVNLTLSMVRIHCTPAISLPMPQMTPFNKEAVTPVLIEKLIAQSHLIRKLILENHTGFGCLSGALSMVELYAALYHWYADPNLIAINNNERIRIIAKSTSGLAFFSTLHSVGLLSLKRLQRYCTADLPLVYRANYIGVDATQYIMGPVLGTAIGIALAAKLKNELFSVICFLSEGELQENIDQAAKAAVLLGLNNLTVIVDCNKLQSYYPITWGDPTMETDESGRLTRQQTFWSACGWRVNEIDGHDFNEILSAYSQIDHSEQPYLILANTIKGKGIPSIEGKLGFQHHIGSEDLQTALAHFKKCSANISVLALKNEGPKKNIKNFHHLNLPKNSKNLGNMRKTLSEWIDRIKEANPYLLYSLDSDCRNIFSEKCTRVVVRKDCYHNSQHIFPGLNERLTFTIATGLAHEGLYSIIGSRVNNLNNANEEWNAICLDRWPVLLVGTRPGIAQADGGPEKCALFDIEIMDKPDGNIYQPANSEDLIWLLEKLYSDPLSFLPAYIRVPDFENIGEIVAPQDNQAWQNGYYVMLNGHLKNNYLAIIGSGDSLREITAAAMSQILKNHIKVINLFNLKYINALALQKTLQGAYKVYSMIEARSRSITELIFSALSPTDRMFYQPLGLEKTRQIIDKNILIKEGANGARDHMLAQAKLDTASLILRWQEDIHLFEKNTCTTTL